MLEDDELVGLVRAAQGGDRLALDDLLARLRPLVERRCAKFLPYRMDAEEAAQDALMTIAGKLGSFTGRGSFLGWVTVVTSNSARQTYRSLRRRADRAGAVPPSEPVDPRTTSVIAGTRIDLMEALADLERSHPALVEAFVLRDLGSLSYDEIADITQAPLGTVKDRIHRARTFMRERLRVTVDGEGVGGPR